LHEIKAFSGKNAIKAKFLGYIFAEFWSQIKNRDFDKLSSSWLKNKKKGFLENEFESTSLKFTSLVIMQVSKKYFQLKSKLGHSFDSSVLNFRPPKSHTA